MTDKSPDLYGRIEQVVPGLPTVPGDTTIQQNPNIVNPVDAADGPAVLMDSSTQESLPGWAQGAALRDAGLAPVPSVGKTLYETVKYNPTFRAVDRWNRPDFTGEEVVLSEYLANLPMQLSESELSYLSGLPRRADALQYGVQEIEKQRKANAAFAAHPIAGVVASFIDPTNLIPLGTYGLAARAGLGVRAAVGAGIGAATFGAITAAQEGPVSEGEIAMNLLLGAGAGALGAALAAPATRVLPELERGSKGLSGAPRGTPVPDPTVPPEGLVAGAAEMANKEGAQVKPRLRQNAAGEWVPVKAPPVPEAKAAEVEAKALLGDATDTASVDLLTAEKQVESNAGKLSQTLGQKIEWSIAKKFESFGDIGKRISAFLFDRPGSVGNSLDALREADHRELRRVFNEVEDSTREAMQIRGYKWWNVFTPTKSIQLQSEIEYEVARALQAREMAGHRGLPVNEQGLASEIKKIADAQERAAEAAKRMAQRAGVEGMDSTRDIKGYFHRQWSSVKLGGAMQDLIRIGLTERKAKAAISTLFYKGIKSMDPTLDDEIAKAVGSAIVDRAIRKGDFSDNVWHTPHSGDDIREITESLKRAGVRDSQMRQAIELMQGKSDEAGKVSFAKGRILLDYDEMLVQNGVRIRLGDLVDTRLNTVNERYAKSVATNSALAKKGVLKRSDLDKLRAELIESIPLGSAQRREAEELWQNTMNWYYGRPSGQQLNQFMRNLQGLNRTIALRNSGIWQVSEYATALAEYGAGAVLKNTLRSSKLFEKLMRPDSSTASSLNRVLSDMSEQSTRIRPYLSMFEDGYTMAETERLGLTLQRLQQFTPYANGMKFIHGHQSRLVANLIVDRIISAGKGDAKARAALAKYGLDETKLNRLTKAIAEKGDNVDAWPDTVWDDVRPALVGMMDEAVLKARLGDIPAFAAFDELGKFLFTFRSFTLAAHNKLLSRKLQQDGAGAMGLLLMYQMPLTALAVQAQAVLSGKGPLNEKELALLVPGQMGGLGLFTDAFNVLSGRTQDAGSPGLIPIDRALQAVGQATDGDARGTASALLGLVPVVSSVPFMRALQEQVKGDEPRSSNHN